MRATHSRVTRSPSTLRYRFFFAAFAGRFFAAAGFARALRAAAFFAGRAGAAARAGALWAEGFAGLAATGFAGGGTVTDGTPRFPSGSSRVDSTRPGSARG
jgi:hypothetical protein